MVPSALTVADLAVDYGETTALTGVSLTLERGASLAVIGPNGSGKSTLLQVVAGLVSPSAGSVDRHGCSVALVLQSTDVDRGTPLTVRDTVGMARYATRGLLGRFRDDDRKAISRSMDRLDIADLADRQLLRLSGGQRQRVLVAQGLAQGADVLLLDEPITGLDIASRKVILEVIEEERRAGRAVIMTTHNLEDARVCERVLLLATCMVALGPPAEVIQEEHLRVAFGGRVVRVGDDFVMDDPHHHHEH